MAEVDERGSLGSTPTRFYRCDVCGMPHELVPGERRCLFGEDTPSERSSAPERAGGPEKIAGRYVVRGELGAGAFGVVYDCWDLRLDRQVAVKVGPLPEDDPVAHRRFLREARMMAEVSDPGTVLIYDFGVAQETGRAFISMEVLHGETLGARLARGVPPLREALDTMFDLLAALGTFHDRGIIHRDLKPENVFIHELNPRERIVKVLDFGLARPVEAHERITEEDELVGTPMYMAPELILGRPADTRADVFALGGLLLELLTGEDPVPHRRGESLMGFVARAAREPRRRLREDRPDLPEALDEVVHRALSLDPAGRYASAHELFDALMEATGRETMEESASWRLS